MYKLFNDNCVDVMQSQLFLDIVRNRKVVIVTDPPFNIGYHYKGYKDKMDEKQYYIWLCNVFRNYPFVVIHYPESIYKISSHLCRFPEKVISWVYNSNTARQHRDIAFFNIKPDLCQVTQPYKNQNDKRIQKLISNGKKGCRLYDWWNVNQVKNVSKDKTGHPCQMPIEVMNNIIGILPKSDDLIVVDPFMGSGTTGVACINHNIDFIGIELVEDYYKIAKYRLSSTIKGEEE